MLTLASILLSSTLALGQAEENLVPENVRSQMEFLVGEWEVDISRVPKTGPEVSLSGRYTAMWADGGHALILRYEPGDFVGVGISGWDPTSKELVETWYTPSLGRLELRYKIDRASPNVWEGTARDQSPTGQVTKGTIRLEKNGNDEFKFTLKTEDLTLTNVNRRITHQDHLSQVIKPLIGEWRFDGKSPAGGRVPEGTQMVADVDFRWILNGNAAAYDVHVQRDGHPDYEVHGIISWDPLKKQIVGRAVNSSGASDYSVWTRDGDRVVAKLKGIGPDGKPYSASGVYSISKEADVFVYQGVDRMKDGVEEPNGPKVELRRVSD